MLKKILVIGASRGIGLAVTRLALAQGYSVRALARQAQGIAVAHAQLEKISADARSASDMQQALNGVQIVVQALGVPLDLKLLTGPIDLFSAATGVLLPAMQAAGVRRLLCVTGFGAGDSNNTIHPLQRFGFKLVFGRAYADKTTQESLIRQSSLDWTIVRPGMLTQGAATHRYRVLAEPHTWRNGIISRTDVADFLVKQFTSEQYLKQAPVLVG
jgi:putative NADH-flavin reductase